MRRENDKGTKIRNIRADEGEGNKTTVMRKGNTRRSYGGVGGGWKEGEMQSNVEWSIYRPPPRLLGMRIIAWGWRCNRERNWWAKGVWFRPSLPILLSLSPRLNDLYEGGGHVMDACTHVHKMHLCEHRGKSRDDVNDLAAVAAVTFQSCHTFVRLSWTLSPSSLSLFFHYVSYVIVTIVTVVVHCCVIKDC